MAGIWTAAGAFPRDVLGIKASEAGQIVDPHLGVQRADDDTSNLKRLVQRYLEKIKAGAHRRNDVGFHEQVAA